MLAALQQTDRGKVHAGACGVRAQQPRWWLPWLPGWRDVRLLGMGAGAAPYRYRCVPQACRAESTRAGRSHAWGIAHAPMYSCGWHGLSGPCSSITQVFRSSYCTRRQPSGGCCSQSRSSLCRAGGGGSRALPSHAGSSTGQVDTAARRHQIAVHRSCTVATGLRSGPRGRQL